MYKLMANNKLKDKSILYDERRKIESLCPTAKYIPPRFPNANADVVSSHKLIQNEFYSIEPFYSKLNFLYKAKTFHLHFNFTRKNSYKNYKTPVDILKEYNLNENIAFIQPFIIDDLYRHNFFLIIISCTTMSVFLPFFFAGVWE